jgi:enterochelin esterase family protein
MIDFIENEARDRELACYQPFSDFVVQEVLPWVHQHYAITQNPAHTLVTGCSRGGLAAAYVALQHPEVFGLVLSQSGSFYWKPDHSDQFGWLIQQYANSPSHPIRFYLEVGSLETYGVVPGHEYSSLISTRMMYETLITKGYMATCQEFQGGHDYYCWKGTIANGLKRLLQAT